MRIAVVVPALDEEREIVATLEALLAQGPDDVVVVDGGSQDRTRDVAARSVRLIEAPRGRASQMNAGARATESDVLVFLHADCELAPGSLAAIKEALADPAVVGGGFHKTFRSRHPLLRRAVRPRTLAWHRLGYVFGDQAQFIRREAFETLGGFREDVRAEDMDLSWRMTGLGRRVLIEPAVRLSPRRFERDGVLATWARWWRVGVAEGWRVAREGRRQGALSSEPKASRDSS